MGPGKRHGKVSYGPRMGKARLHALDPYFASVGPILSHEFLCGSQFLEEDGCFRTTIRHEFLILD